MLLNLDSRIAEQAGRVRSGDIAVGESVLLRLNGHITTIEWTDGDVVECREVKEPVVDMTWMVFKVAAQV